ncbi:DSS1/SEM1 family protein [Mucor mucedo]|uniref:DSS1/SEM1 family protein n=1 Tax=Mucor mucedo TaxID=29922 RepID=UPI00221E67F3|nr:DSS1/SEM1 family protein [Mucor mucedo]KAI7896903.1 DSS1/SEM1 family protein [Mucor mucedo]
MSSSNTVTPPKIQDKPLEEEPAKKNGQLGALEEDDEFEEFVAEDWEENDEENLDDNLWDDNWDDDDVEEDFSVVLQ